MLDDLSIESQLDIFRQDERRLTTFSHTGTADTGWIGYLQMAVHI